MAGVTIQGIPELERAMKNFVKNARQAPITVAKMAMVQLVSDVIPLTRVLTGRLVGGWMISYGPVPVPGVNFYSDGVDRKASAAAVRQSQIDRDTKDANAWDGKGSIIWLSNNVKYAESREFIDYMLQTAIAGLSDRIQALADKAAA